jgi:cell division protein ZapE
LQDPVLSTRIQDRYRAHIHEGLLERDAAQEAIARRLDRLLDELVEYRLARKSSPLGWLFGRRMAGGPPRGLYIFGAVGGGKTMLMDLFFEAATARRKRRVHFHAFMADVHARIHDWRQKLKQGLVRGEDPIAPIAAALAAEAWLLCFDEFNVSDIADAMILGRLFQALFAAGVVVVATSNVAPERLYEGGLNRALFLPFIGLLAQKMDVVELASRTDFRLEKLAGAPVYHVPADAKARAALGHAFKALTGVAHGAPLALPVLGRKLVVPEAAANVARFSFAELCQRPLAAADYLVIAERFHTLLIDAIPVLSPDQRNEAKRFIILIDAAYDQHVKVIASAAAEPHGLYLGRDGREAFEFHRTASRLIEMRSRDYLALPHGAATSAASGDTDGLVET